MTKSFGVKRNLDYFKEAIKIQIKSLNEYKLNMYSGMILAFIFTFSISIFLYVVYVNFNDFVNWGFNEYYFFVIFNALIIILFSTFSFGMNLSNTILSGDLNMYLVKPMSTLWQYLINGLSLFLVFNAFSYFLLFIGFIFFHLEQFNYLRLIIVLIFGTFAGFAHVFILRMLDSISFFIKNNTTFFNFYYSFKGVYDRFPLGLFNKSITYKIGLFFPNVYAGFFSSQYFFGHISFLELLKYFSI